MMDEGSVPASPKTAAVAVRWEQTEEEQAALDKYAALVKKGLHRIVFGRPEEENPVRNNATIAFAVPKVMHSAITIYAKRAGVSRSVWLRSVFAAALNEHLQQQPRYRHRLKTSSNNPNKETSR